MPEKFKVFAHEYVVSLFPLFNLVDAINIGIKKVLGTPVYIAAKIQDHMVAWCQLPKNWQAAHLALVARIKKDPAFSKMICREIEELGQKQVKATAALKLGLTGKTNRELAAEYERFLESNLKVYTYGLLIVLFDFQDTTFLSDELKVVLEKRHAGKYFDVLTMPLRDTYNKQQDLDLLKIFSLIRKNKTILSLFKKLPSGDLARVLIKRNPALWKKLKLHSEKYAWVNYVYEGPAADVVYFFDILRDFAKRNINPTKDLAVHRQDKACVKKEQSDIIKKLKLNQYETIIINLAREIVFFKAFRRELQSHAYYHVEFLLREIGRRLGLSLGQTRMMLPNEIRSALLKGTIKTDEINRRLQLVVYAARPTKTICLSAQAARDYLNKNIEPEKKVKKANEIKGAVAYPGQVRGTVRIINSPDQISKMKDGDILVSHATNPNLMPAIRKAAAIVTDEGGLTCHAAIVAREFKIPCVIGTQIGSQIFSDGDTVEVDATKGIVKKL